MNTEAILEKTTCFRDDLLKDLTDTEFAMYYLEAALADYKRMTTQSRSGWHCVMW